MKTLAILLLTTALGCYAQAIQPTPVIKGHTLGESVQQFTTNADDLTRGLIYDCTAHNNVSGPKESGCDEFLQIVGSGSGTLECSLPMYKSGVCRNFDGVVKFDNRKLVNLTLRITDKEWSEALGDVVTKFGKPDETRTNTVQNGYGAKFDLQTATWTAPDYL